MSESLKKVRDDSAQIYAQVLTLQAALQTWMVRRGYPMYQNAQKKRWMTSNASEGDTWKPLSTPYLNWKLKMRAKNPEKYPGGNKTLVLTGDLFGSVSGQKPALARVVFEQKGFKVFTTVPYAKYVNDVRPFVGFGKETDQKIKDDVTSFIQRHLKGRTFK